MPDQENKTIDELELSEKRDLGHDLETVVGREVRGRSHEELAAEIRAALEDGGRQAVAILNTHGVTPPDDLAFDQNDDYPTGEADPDTDDDKPVKRPQWREKGGGSDDGGDTPDNPGAADDDGQEAGQPAEEVDIDDVEIVQIHCEPNDRKIRINDVIVAPVPEVTRRFPHAHLDDLEGAKRIVEAAGGRFNWKWSTVTAEVLE